MPAGEMTPEEFREAARETADWIADYFANVEQYPVLPSARPGELVDKLPRAGPERGEPWEAVFGDFQRLVLPHVTHWNHPGFMAYFASPGSAPGVLGETLSAALNTIGLLWKSSPALAELEQVVLKWLLQWLDLPRDWFGMIDTTASTATLHAVLAAREDARRRRAGELDLNRLTIYASEQAHMSVEKTMLVLGRGREACRKIAVDDEYRMIPEALEAAVEADLAAGLIPIAVCATVGTTSTSSVDPVERVAEIAARRGLWLHVDAAYAGPCAMLPEKRPLFAGCERADSFVVNPHKWLFTPMDLTALYTARPEVFRAALSLTPDYLRSAEDPRAVNFMEYTIPLGRRFRALKLWFILRHFGREGLVALLREHIRLAHWLAERIDEHPAFERVAPTPFALVCFRPLRPGADASQLDDLAARLLDSINRSGEFFISSTRLRGRLTLRAAIGHPRVEARHVERLWELLQRSLATLVPAAE